MSTMDTELWEYRFIIERPLGPRESRVQREERTIRTEAEADRLAGYWTDRVHPTGARGWVERRRVTLWEDYKPVLADGVLNAS
jgi:hypothetical protein